MRKKSLEVYQLALKMAGSGKVRNWEAIQTKLVEQGHRKAPQLLDGQKIRAILDLRCDESRKNK